MVGTIRRNIDKIANIFGVNSELLRGFLGILCGDFYSLAVMAAPIADIDPEIIEKLILFIKEIKRVLEHYYQRRSFLEARYSNLRDSRDQYREISHKILEGKASYN